ncbi:SIS domain-containing protein [Halioglobus pacificus]|uniref:RpiR family transcriptional regulator n=1 Tax=Parahalioglobus pacificus TaxID=930806 RepID=A0A918XKC5_9GAMM|nr:SIS domain-containing protein [Halioglobus pacificus]GHD34922.1 RpiR family transcriptional regulator [Halioglobus pacificus]
MSQPILQHIADSLDTLRRSERKVAEWVLAQPQSVIHMRIVDLAAAVGVSEPTVVRFCRAIGCEGFQNFKLAVAQSGVRDPATNDFRLSELDTARDYTYKVFDTTMSTLQRVRDTLDPDAIEIAVDALGYARRVEFYGFGASSPVAIDAQHKFFRLQIASSAYSDPHIQAMAAMSLSPEDVVVAISQSGRTTALLEAMDHVHESGAVIIGLAPGDTPVLNNSTIAIPIDVASPEDESYTPLPSRIAHLAVIDILAVGVSKMKGSDVDRHLIKLNRGLQTLRVKD